MGNLKSLRNVGFGGAGGDADVPKVLAELQGLTVSGPIAGAGANASLVVAGIDSEDTIIKCLDLTTPADVAVGTITILDRRAQGTVTLLGTLVDADTVTVNGKVYTFKNIVVNFTTNLANRVIPITQGSVNVTDAATRLANSIMSNDSTLTCTTAAGVVTVIARTPGTAGNSIALVTSSAHATVSGATLAGGLAAASGGIKTSVVTTGKNLLLFWYDKTPGQLP